MLGVVRKSPGRAFLSVLAGSAVAFLLTAPGAAAGGSVDNCHDNYVPGLNGSYSYTCTSGLGDYTAGVRCNATGKPTHPSTLYWGHWATAPGTSYVQCPSGQHAVGYSMAV